MMAYHLWRIHGDRILGHPEYRLKTDLMRVTPQPEWIRSDVKQSAVTHGRLHEANMLDRELVLQVKQAFGVQPWVKRVLRVNKQYPSTVEIELEYRRPVALVEVPAGTFPPYNYEGLVPVDDEGYLLPVELTAEESHGFPKIAGVDSSPSGPPGSPWGDPRVVEAVQIVSLLQEAWEKLELYKIEVPPMPSSAELEATSDYVLITRQRRRFQWGPAPGKEARGQATAREKADGLKAFAEQRGPLDVWDEPDAPNVSELLQKERLKR